jgi:hypothetical protein
MELKILWSESSVRVRPPAPAFSDGPRSKVNELPRKRGRSAAIRGAGGPLRDGLNVNESTVASSLAFGRARSFCSLDM